MVRQNLGIENQLFIFLRADVLVGGAVFYGVDADSREYISGLFRSLRQMLGEISSKVSQIAVKT